MFDEEGHWIDDPYMVVNTKIDFSGLGINEKEHICCNCIHEEVCEGDSNVVPMDNSGNCKLFKLKED